MIYSMTGYGAAKGSFGQYEISVELKSVNNRYFDCAIRIPRIYAFAEESIKTRVQSAAARGKVDVFVTIDSSGANDITIKLNETLLGAYMDAFGRMSEKFGVENDVTASVLGRLPDVFVVEKREIDPEFFLDSIGAVLNDALVSFNVMRKNEGGKLCQDIESRLDAIEETIRAIEKRSPEITEQYRKRLNGRMKEILGNADIDESRILLEAALFADKSAIDEELVRLNSHIEQFRHLLEGSGAVGRKADFLVQEMNRETNTIASKCNDLEVTRMTVDLKAEIEKIREQAQNIE